MPKKANQLLSIQRPRKKRPLKRSFKKAKPYLILALLAVFILAGVKLQKLASQYTELVSRTIRPVWRVAVEGDGIDSTGAKPIQEWVQFRVHGPWPDFEKLAVDTQVHFGFETVRLAREGLDVIKVSIKPRNPVLRIQTSSSVRLLSKDLYVFGIPTSEQGSLPILQGQVFKGFGESDADEKLGAVALSDKSEKAAQNALELLNFLEQNGLRPQILNWDEYRGMTAILTPENIEILFGMPPFKDKVGHLSQMLSERKKSAQAMPQRIEIDFDGKAFVKERIENTGKM